MTVSTSIRYVNPDGTVTLAGYTLLRRLDEAGQITAPTGGGVVDVEARAAIAILIAALGG